LLLAVASYLPRRPAVGTLTRRRVLLLQGCCGAARAAGSGGSTTCARTSSAATSARRRRTPSSASTSSSATGTFYSRRCSFPSSSHCCLLGCKNQRINDCLLVASNANYYSSSSSPLSPLNCSCQWGRAYNTLSPWAPPRGPPDEGRKKENPSVLATWSLV
jgi:hypothetical protein